MSLNLFRLQRQIFYKFEKTKYDILNVEFKLAICKDNTDISDVYEQGKTSNVRILDQTQSILKYDNV